MYLSNFNVLVHRCLRIKISSRWNDLSHGDRERRLMYFTSTQHGVPMYEHRANFDALICISVRFNREKCTTRQAGRENPKQLYIHTVHDITLKQSKTRNKKKEKEGTSINYEILSGDEILRIFQPVAVVMGRLANPWPRISSVSGCSTGNRLRPTVRDNSNPRNGINT